MMEKLNHKYNLAKSCYQISSKSKILKQLTARSAQQLNDQFSALQTTGSMTARNKHFVNKIIIIIFFVRILFVEMTSRMTLNYEMKKDCQTQYSIHPKTLSNLDKKKLKMTCYDTCQTLKQKNDYIKRFLFSRFLTTN